MGDVPTVISLGEREKAEVDSVLGSAVFVRSPRLSRLLKYLTAKYFEGEVDQIKEYNIAVDVLGRPESFDPSEDAIARVEVHRLRKKLREYYETEGADHALRVVIPTGHYVPVFMLATEATGDGDALAMNGSDSTPAANRTRIQLVLPATSTNGASAIALRAGTHTSSRPFWKRVWPLLALTVLGLCAVLVFVAPTRPGAPLHAVVASRSDAASRSGIGNAAASVVPPPVPPSAPAVPPLPGVPDPGVRILCGRRSPHTDRWGRLWAADAYFEGGSYFEHSREFLARTFDSALFQGARTGDFNYHIPLKPGVYELRLYFAETTFGPPNGGGENSRMFHVAAEHRRILSEFDILSDAGGPGIADERVFKNISPGPDGLLHIRFMSVTSQAMVNAIELEPARPHRLNPVRLIAQESAFTDSKQHVWLPDNYWIGGQAGIHSARIDGTEDRQLFAKERYGHFSYAIPADEGEYAVTLYFAENFWGRENPGGGGVGSRVFEIFCNGVALARNFDIYKEAGGNRALLKTYHRMKPNAQGKLLLSFVPVRNYASIYAIEVEDESRE